MTTLTRNQVSQRVKELQGWRMLSFSIKKEYAFGNFVQAMEFVNRVARLAEAEGHHPDIAVHYNVVTRSLWTHSAGGVTQKDFALERKLDTL